MSLSLAMDMRYSYYTPSAHDALPTQRPTQHDYSRPSTHHGQAAPTAGYPYAQQGGSLSGSLPPSYHAGASYTPHPSSPYHNNASQSMSNALPPLVHGQGYSRDVTHSGRHDVPSAFAVPSLGQTLHDLPFSAPQRAGSSSNRNSGSWAHAHTQHHHHHHHQQQEQASPRTPPAAGGSYDRSPPTYPAGRPGGSHHPSLSHSTTHLIPTPAQTAQTYHHHHAHGYAPGTSSSPSSSSPPVVVAAIPPASGLSPPQERYFCEKCDKSFGRQHDKKRHYESTHLQQSHTCRFCHKTFSRNDSLKRHQDNGCDKDPDFHP